MHAAKASERAKGPIIREREPVNFEYPFDQLSDFLTPNDLFYIRSHFKAPHLDAESYRLRIEGAVRTPLSITYPELRKLPGITRAATLECAGNWRVFLSPQVEGAQWQLGAVSTADWTGVALSTLLEMAGIAEDACEIVFEGADRGTPRQKPTPPGETPYTRSIGCSKAADVLLAYSMNGEDLPIDHGYPLRALVCGFYGMASVKWLTHIRVVREPFRGYWQTSDYAYWDDLNGNPVRRALDTMAVKAAIARPSTREVIPAGQPYTVFGAAWGGQGELAEVEVSTDDGASWQRAEFQDAAQPFVWRRWSFIWQVPTQKGIHVVKARARDCHGNTQPEEHDPRFGTYVIHHTIGIEVIVQQTEP